MAAVSSSARPPSPSLLDKLDEIAPAPLAQFDAFPKLPSTYKTRSESRGFLTLFVAVLAFLLVLNDLGEYIFGWPDFEFSVDADRTNDMKLNVDLVVNMPCQYLSVDLRDAVGDRLFLSSNFRRDGTKFDVGQATSLKEHAEALSARQAIAQSRSSRGLLDTLFQRNRDPYRPTYNYEKDASACRIYGTISAKKVTANLHVTTLGHGYQTGQHVHHQHMNLSHVITEFSFGPYFPDIVQPLDDSFEFTDEQFVAYTYFLHVVPTTYIAPRSAPLQTYQYSVTHYTRTLQPHQGVPGIFFKFDIEPVSLTIHQRTTTFVQLLIRCVGVIGGLFVCMGYAVRIGTRAVEAVTGADKSVGLIEAESSGVGVGLRKRFGSTDLRLRSTPRMVQQGAGWVVEGGSPYSSYVNTPVAASHPSSPYTSGFPAPPLASALSSPNPETGGSRRPTSMYGLGISSPGFGPAPSVMSPPLSSSGPRPQSIYSPYTSMGMGSAFPTAATAGSPYTPDTGSLPPTPGGGDNMYAHFPPTPNSANGAGAGFPRSPRPGASALPPPPGQSRRESWLRHESSGSTGKAKGD